MKVRKAGGLISPFADSTVTLTIMGNILEVRYQMKEIEPKIQKYDKDHYIDLRTGELCKFNHNTTRAEDIGSVAQSLRRLRAIINTNVTNPQTALWITLTYRDNMTDPKQLYEDFRRFQGRLITYHRKNYLPHYEYITAAEPQGRGAWHMHLLLIYSERAPFIPNDSLAQIWRHGFTKTTALKNVNNVGAYLSAYLGDMSLEETLSTGNLSGAAEVKELTQSNGQSSKYYVKGARLRLYPKGFRLYRKSKGIRLPKIAEMSYADAMKIVGAAHLTYEKSIELFDEQSGVVYNQISYKQYNRVYYNNTKHGTSP